MSQDQAEKVLHKFDNTKYIYRYTIFSILLGLIFYLISSIRYFLDSDQLSFTLGTIQLSIYLLIKSVISLIFVVGTILLVLKFAEQKIRILYGIKDNSSDLLVKAIYIITGICIFFVVLTIVGLGSTSVVLFGSAIGIGIGFGLQKIAANFIAGVILLLEKSFKIGDLIELNDKTTGFVRQMGARYILVETFCGKEIMVPNIDFINTKIVNLTYRHSVLRVEITIKVSYKEDINKVKKIILDGVKTSSDCLKEPEPICMLQDVNAGLISFILRFWVEDVGEGFMVPQNQVRLAIWEHLQKKGISIPIQLGK